MQELTVVDRIAKALPAFNFNSAKLSKRIQWLGKHISTPESVLIVGATALASQPFFDLYNKKTDEKTRKVSCYRTISKIIATTLTGFLIRRGFINLVKNNSVIGEEVSKTFKKFFTPSDATDFDHAYEKYQNGLGTILALITMIFTNFAIDAPLTMFLTHRLAKKTLEKDEKGGDDK